MVLWIPMLFSIFYCAAGKLKRCRNLRGAFTLCHGSDVVDCNSVVVDRYIVSFDLTDRCCFWKTVLYWFGLLDASSGSWLICCFNVEYKWAYLRLKFLQLSCGNASWQDSGCSVESIRVVWSVSPAWESVRLTLGDRIHLPIRGP
jgi:hypothetical protein